MTATSSLPFANMDVPTAEEPMELGSPYYGALEDFDIDIDLMEENVSNMDSDMMGADDPPNTSQPSLLQNDLNDDADMADEPSEGSMVDAENIVDEDYDVDLQLDETYETEMLEDDQDDTIDAAPPGIQIDASATTEGQAESTQDVPIEEPVDLLIEESIQGTPAVPDIPQEESLAESGGQGPIIQEQDIFVEGHEVENAAPEQSQENETAQPTVSHDTVGPKDTNQTTENNHPHVEELHAPSIFADNSEASEVKSSSHKIAEEHAKHAETPSVHETQDQGADDESLHPVKVLYQDSEISLFPPFEGDSAETFFLHDENVAYDSFGKLFSSLRGVLLDNVAGNEVLVIDIDVLGIQLTEDSSYTSKITLHQILDIYLRLCYNDGSNDPEALYLTLSSRLAVDSELASLSAAANEGKGLSQLDLYDDLEEAGVDAGEIPNSGEATHLGEEPPQGESQHDESPHEVAVGPEGQASLGDESEEDLQQTSHAEQHPEADHEHLSMDHVSQPESADFGSQDDKQEKDQTEKGNATEAGESSPVHQVKNSFESEPGSASTSTVAPHDQPQDGATDVEDTADHQDFGDQADQAVGTGDDEFPEDDFTVQHEADEEEPEFQGEIPHEEDVAQAHFEPTAAQEDEADSADVSQHDIDHTSYDQSESTVQEAAQDTRPPKEQTPEPEADLFDIAEDVMQTPAKDPQNDLSENLEGEIQDEFAEDDLAGSVNGEGVGDQQNDDGDLEDWYPDLEVTEATELGETDPSLTDSQPHDNPSTKRSREGDGEWDIADATTPDTKRRRS